MRIAHLSVFYPYRGGISQFNANLFRALEKSHEIRAFNYSRQYPALLFPGKTQYVSKGDKADPIESMRMLDSINPLSWKKTAKEILAFNPDLVLLRYWTPVLSPAQSAVLYYVRKKNPRIKIISILDNVVPHEKRPFDSILTRSFLKKNHAFIVMSEQVKSELLEFIPEAKHILKPHPIYEHFPKKLDKATARKSLGIGAEHKLVLFFGFIRPYKGLDTLLTAIVHQKTATTTLIAGECYGSFKEYGDLIEELGIENKLILKNEYLDDEMVARVFSASDLCVLPYKSATQSGIIPVAYHYELPVVSTKVGGLKEYLLDGETGYLVSPNQPEEIAHAIDKFFANNNTADQFKTGIRKLKNEYSWRGFADSIIQLASSIDLNRQGANQV